ncbi:MAG: ADP-ribosylglycohydrolase family protein, partial [Myxococcota bacterium]
NGAAVRVAPIALWMRSTDEEETANAARASAIPTHAHPAAIHGAVGVALVLRRLLEGATRDAATAALEGWEDLARGSPDLSPQEAYEQYGHGVVIEETVPAAVWAFLGARSFDGALARVVALGGDTDSIGAIVGAFAGAHFGFEAIRPVCVDALEKTACATVERFIERLARR